MENNGWSIYAHVLEMLAAAFCWSVGVAVVVALVVTPIAGSAAVGIAAGVVVGSLVWPLMFARRSDEIYLQLRESEREQS